MPQSRQKWRCDREAGVDFNRIAVPLCRGNTPCQNPQSPGAPGLSSRDAASACPFRPPTTTSRCLPNISRRSPRGWSDRDAALYHYLRSPAQAGGIHAQRHARGRFSGNNHPRQCPGRPAPAAHVTMARPGLAAGHWKRTTGRRRHGRRCKTNPFRIELTKKPWRGCLPDQMRSSGRNFPTPNCPRPTSPTATRVVRTAVRRSSNTAVFIPGCAATIRVTSSPSVPTAVRSIQATT